MMIVCVCVCVCVNRYSKVGPESFLSGPICCAHHTCIFTHTHVGVCTHISGTHVFYVPVCIVHGMCIDDELVKPSRQETLVRCGFVLALNIS